MLAPLNDTPAASAFERAREAFDRLRNEQRIREDRRDRLKAAQNLATLPTIAERSEHLAEKIGMDVIEHARGWPNRVAAEIETLTIAIEEAAPALATARDEHQLAAVARTEEIALALQPRHQAAVTDIARALEHLSRALAAETDVRAELGHQAPLPTSALLPDLSTDLRFGDLSRWDSAASNWARRARSIGVLK
jgi:hypothetical protein